MSYRDELDNALEREWISSSRVPLVFGGKSLKLKLKIVDKGSEQPRFERGKYFAEEQHETPCWAGPGYYWLEEDGGEYVPLMEGDWLEWMLEEQYKRHFAEFDSLPTNQEVADEMELDEEWFETFDPESGDDK